MRSCPPPDAYGQHKLIGKIGMQSADEKYLLYAPNLYIEQGNVDFMPNGKGIVDQKA